MSIISQDYTNEVAIFDYVQRFFLLTKLEVFRKSVTAPKKKVFRLFHF